MKPLLIQSTKGTLATQPNKRKINGGFYCKKIELKIEFEI